MIELKGKYDNAVVYSDEIEEAALKQIMQLINSPAAKNAHTRIMADNHYGAGCVIGTTMRITDRVCPNLVGVDIGCSMSVYELGQIDLDLPAIDNFINNNIPSGMNVNDEYDLGGVEVANLLSALIQDIRYDYALQSVGTLGSGNHFLEIDVDNDGNKYVVIHSGSRHLGIEIANAYQKIAAKSESAKAREALVATLKAEGREKEIQEALKSIPKSPAGLECLEGEDMQNYLHDMKLVQKYAEISHRVMMHKIIGFILGSNKFDNSKYWRTVHNYIDTENMILRKGAVSAQKGERILIPINMRDGSIIAIGKGNPEYNYSGPHGAGRIMSRSRAKEEIPFDIYKESMEGIYSTSVTEGTIDESPFAYKDISTILKNIKDTVEVEKIIKPIYNYKSS